MVGLIRWRCSINNDGSLRNSNDSCATAASDASKQMRDPCTFDKTIDGRRYGQTSASRVQLVGSRRTSQLLIIIAEDLVTTRSGDRGISTIFQETTVCCKVPFRPLLTVSISL